MHDVIPPHDRSIRNIPVPAHRKRPASEDVSHHEQETAEMHAPMSMRESDVYAPRRPRRGSLWLWLVSAGLVGVLLAVLLSYFFAGATITVTPKRESVPAATAVTAKIDAPLGTLPYQTITQSVTGSRTVPSSGESQVSKRASGTITISNSYSTTKQRLIKNTRFEAANGKIYRVDTSVEVPGATKKADGTLAPGTVDAQVFADSPGPEYNQGPTTFTIPGFKGDPRYTKFSAASSGQISGGFVGMQKTVKDEDVQAARTAIASEMSAKLTETLKQNVPSGFLYVEGSERVVTEDMPQGSDGSGAVISVRGTATGAIVQADYLASALLKAFSKDYTGEAVYFADISAALPQASSRLSEDLKGDLQITLKNDAEIAWRFDEDGLKTALVGAKIADLQGILGRFKPAVESASATVRPLWTSTFPKDSGKLKLIVKVK